MKKVTFLTIAVIVLILLNIAVLVFVSTKENTTQLPEGRPQRPKEIVIKKLQFNEVQQQKYEVEIAKHQAKIRKLDKAIRENKHKLYDLLTTTYNEKQKDSLIGVIVANKRKVEEAHFEHFQDIKAICSENQIDDFEELVLELPKIFSPQGKRRPKQNRPPHPKP